MNRLFYVLNNVALQILSLIQEDTLHEHKWLLCDGPDKYYKLTLKRIEPEAIYDE